MILSGSDYLAKEEGSKATLKNKSNHTSIKKNSQVPRRYPKTPQMLAKSEGDPALSKTNSNKVRETIFWSISFSLSFDIFRSMVNQKERRKKKARQPKETW